MCSSNTLRWTPREGVLSPPPRDAWSERVFRFPIGVLATVACAALSYYLVEIPMLRIRDRLLRRARRVPAIAPVGPAA